MTECISTGVFFSFKINGFCSVVLQNENVLTKDALTYMFCLAVSEIFVIGVDNDLATMQNIVVMFQSFCNGQSFLFSERIILLSFIQLFGET